MLCAPASARSLMSMYQKMSGKTDARRCLVKTDFLKFFLAQNLPAPRLISIVLVRGACYRPESSFIPSEGRRLWIATRKARCVKQRHVFFSISYRRQGASWCWLPRQLPGSREAAKTVLHSKAKIEYFVIVLHPNLGRKCDEIFLLAHCTLSGSSQKYLYVY